MGRRHGKNATANPVYSYAEFQKDNSFSGYGAVSARLGKDSIKDFDCCSLTLQPCRNPVITPDGHLFDKESILENIVQQKLEVAKKLKEYERWKKKTENQQKELEDAAKRAEVERFQKTSSSVTTIGKASSQDEKKAPNNFWGSASVKASLQEVKAKPDTVIRNPVTGNPIKASDLIPVKFTPHADDDDFPLASKKFRYMCPVTHDVLTNFVPCVVLRTSGNVVTQECFENLIKKDMIDPISGKLMTEKDVIPLQRGGSGFAGSGLKLESKVSKPAMSVG